MAKESSNRQRALLGLAYREHQGGVARIRFRWMLIFSILAVMAATLWIGKSVAFYYYLKEMKNFPEVTLGDAFLYPIHRGEIREQMGNYHVAEGIRLWKEGEYREAGQLLMIGVARAPENYEGRKYLGQYLFVQQRPDLAIKTFEEGLPHSEKDIEYLKIFLGFLMQMREDAKIRELADELLPKEPETTTYNRILANAAAQSALYRGDFDAAEDYINDYELTNMIEGVLLSAQIDWSRGHQEAAIDKLESFASRHANAPLDAIYSTLSRYYREMGNTAAAQRCAVLRTIQNPQSAGPRIEVLYAYHYNDAEKKEAREIEAIIDEFRNDEQAIQGLANFATDTGNTQLSRRTYEMALENNFSIAVFGLLFIEAHLVAGDYEGAIRFCNEVLKERPEWLTKYESVFNSLRSVAYFGLGNEELGYLYLDKFLQREDTRVPTLLSISRRYREIDRLQEAQRVLRRAFELDPHNQVALSGIIEASLDLGDSRELVDRIRALLKLRRPDYQLLRRAYNELSSDRFIFAGERENLLIDLATILEIRDEDTAS